MKRILTAALIAGLATPALAGGPVIVEDTEVVVEKNPSSGLVLPLVLAIVVGVALLGNDDEGGARPSH